MIDCLKWASSPSPLGKFSDSNQFEVVEYGRWRHFLYTASDLFPLLKFDHPAAEFATINDEFEYYEALHLACRAAMSAEPGRDVLQIFPEFAEANAGDPESPKTLRPAVAVTNEKPRQLSADEGPSTDTSSSVRAKKKRGRRPVDPREEVRRVILLNEWMQEKASRTLKDFCHSKGMNAKEFRAIQAWEATRKTRANNL